MKCLTIVQPYAELIASGAKRVENRTWPTRYRGPLLIHAGKNRTRLDEYDTGSVPLAFGAVIARVNLIDCVSMEDIERGAYAKTYPWIQDHEHATGPWCFVLSDAKRINPFSVSGRLGLFNIEYQAA